MFLLKYGRFDQLATVSYCWNDISSILASDLVREKLMGFMLNLMEFLLKMSISCVFPATNDEISTEKENFLCVLSANDAAPGRFDIGKATIERRIF